MEQRARRCLGTEGKEAPGRARRVTVAHDGRGGRHPVSSERALGRGRTTGGNGEAIRRTALGRTRPRPEEGRSELLLRMDAEGDEGCAVNRLGGAIGSGNGACAAEGLDSQRSEHRPVAGSCPRVASRTARSPRGGRGPGLTGRARESCRAAEACRRRLMPESEVEPGNRGSHEGRHLARRHREVDRRAKSDVHPSVFDGQPSRMGGEPPAHAGGCERKAPWLVEDGEGSRRNRGKRAWPSRPERFFRESRTTEEATRCRRYGTGTGRESTRLEPCHRARLRGEPS